MKHLLSRLSLSAILVIVIASTPSAHGQWEYHSPIAFTTVANGPSYLGLVFPGDPQYTGGIATDAQGAVYAIDTANGVIRKFSRDGTSATITASVGFHEFHNGLAVDPDGNVYVAQAQRVYKVAPDGTTTVLADGLTYAQAIARRLDGTLFVADTGAHVIRRISPNGTMVTFAGKAGQSGRTDGAQTARFNIPTGVAVDAHGNVFVADLGNSTVRKITPDGFVSTLAGRAGASGHVDGVGSAALFDTPSGIAVDRFGDIYVTRAASSSYDPYVIRRITPDGVVSTLQGTGGYSGLVECGVAGGITIAHDGAIYVTDGWWGALVASAAPPRFAAPIDCPVVTAGGSATLTSNVVDGDDVAYQWLKDGAPIPGATSATLGLADMQAWQLGSYQVRATNQTGSTTSDPVQVAFATELAGALTNLSIRASAGMGDETLIVGFVVGGTGTSDTKPLLLRAVGPTLETDFDIYGALPDPALSLYSGASLVATNNNWGGDARISGIGTEVGAFPFSWSWSRDAAIFDERVESGAYTVHVSSADDSGGIVLAEIYDATPPGGFIACTPRLINLSARTFVGRGDDLLIAGFLVSGTSGRTLLIRAVGPTLTSFDVADVLDDPKLDLYQGSTVTASNDNWSGDEHIAAAADQVGAFALHDDSRDAALVVTVQPGSYTVHVRGVADSTGVALLEIYEVP